MTTDLGQTFFFDSSMLGSGNDAWAQLRRQAYDGAIQLRRASSVGDDLRHDNDPERRARLEAEGAYPEMFGIAVLDISRLDACVLGTKEEGEDLKAIFSAVFPGSNWFGTSSTADHNRRDAMHLHTTKRYGGNAFITRDGALLKKSAVIIAATGRPVMSPETALAFVQRLAGC